MSRRRVLLLIPLFVATGVPAQEEDGAARPCPVAAANPFRAHSWLPPPPLPPPPPPPQAPPLPFTYLGRIEEGGRIAVFLGRPQGTLIVRAGDAIEGTYRVETITPTQAVFTYLPLNEQQPLMLRSTP